jgi:UDP:flavonoid glycosyltransferase YjiC (YdhE family)
MRVLAACSLGGAGHLQPLVPLLDAARGAGHETLVIAPPALAPMVEASGHAYAAGGEPPESSVAPIRERLPVVPAAEASLLGNYELFGRLATDAMLPATERVIAAWRPDLVLRDPCEYASAVVAHRAGLPVAQVAIGLAEVEWRSIEVAAPALEAHRSGLTDEIRRSPYLTRFPASLDPSPFLETRRFREPAPQATRPLPDWWDGSDAPLVYVSFGTVLGHMSMAAATYRTALLAVAAVGARVLLTVGRAFEIAALGAIPSNVHVEPWVDQVDVLAGAELVVCHGGSGTTFGALGAGVPVVVVPLFADQFANAPKVVAAGAGLVVAAGADARRITAAIVTVLGDSSYRDQARRVAGEMASAATAQTVLAALLGSRKGVAGGP